MKTFRIPHFIQEVPAPVLPPPLPRRCAPNAPDVR